MEEIKKNGQASAVMERRKTQKAVKYAAEELTAFSGKIFGAPRECVVAAFKLSGKKEMTVAEAKEVVKRFMNKEVK